MVSKFYNRNVAEGKGFLIFAVLFAVIIRVVYFFHPEIALTSTEEGGYLWKPLVPLLENSLLSTVVSILILVSITFMDNYIDTEHGLIRKRTLLPAAITLLLFSCLPSQLMMSSSYIGALAMLFVVNDLFKAYNSNEKQRGGYITSFYLALGSLFAPFLLFYLPILWICLARVRSFSFKSFLVSLFSFLVVYTPAFSYFYIMGDIEEFLKPFAAFSDIEWGQLPILKYGINDFLILGGVLFLTAVILIDNVMNSFKDKIRVRAFISVLTILTIYSILCVLMLNINTELTLYVALALGSLQIAHFFSLAQKKLTQVSFFLFVIIVLTISIYPLL